MNPASKDICSILESDSALGLTFATDLFVGKEPATPDNCVSIFDIPGDAPLLTLDGGKNYYFPSVQIRVRNIDYLTGWDLIHNIQTLLHGIHNEIWNSTTYVLIRAVDNPFLLNWDENDRARFVVTFRGHRK